MSIEDQDRLIEVLTVAIGNMLRSSANEMPLEDIEAIDEALSLYGSDPGIAEDAVRDALDKFIPDIDEEISEIGTIDELDDYEKRLNRLIAKRNCVGKSASSDLLRRRERLEEAEYDWDEDSYRRSSTPFPGPAEATNADIKSMFGELSSSRSGS